MTIWKQNVINALTPLQLNTVERYAQGFTYPILAEADGVTSQAIEDRLQKARKNLRVERTEDLCRALGITCRGHKPTLNGGLKIQEIDYANT